MRAAIGTIGATIVAILLLATGASGQSIANTDRQAVFGFAGVELDGLALPIGFEDNYLLALGYQRAWGNWNALLYGVEAGLAGRFSDSASLEAWGGLFARYNFNVDAIRIAPSFTFGLSAVTDTMAGGETQNVADYGGDATLLFYLGPEISSALPKIPTTRCSPASTTAPARGHTRRHARGDRRSRHRLPHFHPIGLMACAQQ